jgi:AcrR family transcriptional regulator
VTVTHGPEQRRRQILEAAADVIAQRGLCDTRIADIARRLGISTGLVLYYFPNKDRLLADALSLQDQLFYEKLQTLAKGQGSATARLVAMIDASCPPTQPISTIRDEWSLWIEMWAASRHDAELDADRRRLDRVWRKALAAVARQGQETGEFSAADPEQFALRLSALIDGLAIQVTLGDPEVTAARMRRTCMELAGLELGFDIGPHLKKSARSRPRPAEKD